MIESLQEFVKVQAKMRRWQSAGLATRLLIISTALLGVGVVAITATAYFQIVDTRMAILAFAVCVISSLVAHIVGEYPSGDDYFMARLALSIAARTGLPFLAVVIAKLSPDLPFEPGFVFLIILFYLVGLVVDVGLNVSRLKPEE